jgi:hypothetical protein
MTNDYTTMTFEEFIQSTMSVVDRVLAASRASENQIMSTSQALAENWRQLPQIEGAPKTR